MYHLLIAKSNKAQSLRAQAVHVEHLSESTIRAYIAINLHDVDVSAVSLLKSTGQFGSVPDGAKAIIVIVQTRDDGDIGVVGIRPFRADDPLHVIHHIVSGYKTDSPIVIGTSDATCRRCTLVAGQLVPVWAGTSAFTGPVATITGSAQGSSIVGIHSAQKSRGRVFVAFSFSGSHVTLPSGHHIESGCTSPDEDKREYAVVRLQLGTNNELQFEDFSCLPKRSADGASSLKDTQVRIHTAFHKRFVIHEPV
jgi:hypothetical protein